MRQQSKNSIEDPALERQNKALTAFTIALNDALDSYFTGGNYNIAAVVGVLEWKKRAVLEYAENLDKYKSFMTDERKTTEYIG